jgi:hypothetical protein
MTDVIVTQAPRSYLIRKGAYWYRPNSQGYTVCVAEAGRYTLAEAENITHPNGPNGPRDGMDFIHENDVPMPHRQSAQADALAVIEEAMGALDGLLSVTANASPRADDQVRRWVIASLTARTTLTTLQAFIDRAKGDE